MPRKYIVVTGGVLSGLGKGIAIASIGKLLASMYKVIPIKCDGYLNVDAGTMNPVEHGEVFVLDDGKEADMDFGHYERYLGVNCKGDWSFTMGKVFNEIRMRERDGEFLGRNVEYIPDVVNHIKDRYKGIAEEEKADIVLIEIGGTVGQIENELYIEACRQLKKDVGNENILYVHLAYVPIPPGVNEQKSKPVQQSVALLRQMGIQPDIIIGRCSEYLTPQIKRKISIFCDVDTDSVITGIDVNDVYKIPIVFEEQGMSQLVARKLNMLVKPDTESWRTLIAIRENATEKIKIAIAGKYTALEDSYASIIEALNHCEAHAACKIEVSWIETTDIESGAKTPGEILTGVDGVIVPGGFGSRGIEGKIKIIQYCRENKVPFLGICLGMQLSVIEYARNVCSLTGAHSTEIDPNATVPVIGLLPEQKNVYRKGGTMRLGGYDIILKEGSQVALFVGDTKTRQRFRHRWEVNPEFVDEISSKGLVFSGTNANKEIMQVIELPGHPYFVGTQFHPELTSRLEAPNPFFLGLVKAALKK